MDTPPQASSLPQQLGINYDQPVGTSSPLVSDNNKAGTHCVTTNYQPFEDYEEPENGLICPPPSPSEPSSDDHLYGGMESAMEVRQKRVREAIEFLVNLHKEKNEYPVHEPTKMGICVEVQIMHAYFHQEIFNQMQWNRLCHSGDADFNVLGECVYLGSMERLIGLKSNNLHDHEPKQVSYTPEEFQKFMGGGPWPKNLFFTSNVTITWNNGNRKYSVTGKYGLFGSGKMTSNGNESIGQAK